MSGREAKEALLASIKANADAARLNADGEGKTPMSHNAHEFAQAARELATALQALTSSVSTTD